MDLRQKNANNFLVMGIVLMEVDVNFCTKSKFFIFLLLIKRAFSSGKKIKKFENIREVDYFSYKKSIDSLSIVDNENINIIENGNLNLFKKSR